MVNLFRRFQQPLLIVLTVFTIISFIVLYNLPTTQRLGPRNQVATIYGRGLTQAEIERTARRLGLLQELGMFEMLMSMVGRVQTQNQAQEAFLWNTLIVRHEAEKLGLMSAQPGRSEQEALAPVLEGMIKALPPFQTNGVFDYAKYAKFLQDSLSPRGFNATELDEVVADSLRLQKIKEVLGSSVAATPAEVREAFRERSQKMELSIVRLKFDDFKAAAKVTDEDVKKLFEERKESLKTPEKRKVKYVTFALPKEPALAGAAKGEALQKLADEAQNFAQSLTTPEAKFEEEAAKAKLTVAETPAFEAAQPPAELESSPSVAQAAFALTKEQPNSDVISAPNGSYILQLSGIEEARPLTYEEAKPKIEEQLKEDRAREAMNLKASELRTKMEPELKAEKAMTAVASILGVTAEKLPPFSAVDPLKDVPEAQEIMRAGAQLAIGQLSEFIPTPSGGMLLHVDRQLPVDEAEFAKEKENLTEGYTRMRTEAIFQEWLRARYKAADIQAVRG